MPQQSVNLKIKGLYTAPNDFGASPEGALEQAENIVIDQQDVAQYRNGFRGLEFAIPGGDHAVRFVEYQTQLLARFGTDSLGYYSDIDGWHEYSGTFANPSSDAKSRFNQANKNLFVTTADGVQVLDSYTGAWRLAGIPKGLDLAATLTGSSGFFTPNEVVSVTANTSNGSPDLAQVSDISAIQTGMFVSGTGIPTGTFVLSITQSVVLIKVSSSTTVAGSNSITVSSIAGVAAGDLVTGDNIPDDTRVVSTSGAGPYAVILNNNAFGDSTTANITFSSDPLITLSANATATNTATVLSFSLGSQVGYRLLFGLRDANQNLLLGAPSQIATVTNTLGISKETIVTGSLPAGVTTAFFWQLYRSPITAASTIPPLDQYQLVYEANITGSDVSNGYVTVTDNTPDSLKGVPLYCGSDQEGILQANDPPPFCHDICTFSGMTFYANTVSEEALDLTILGVGSPNGVQANDVLTIDGVTFTAKTSETIASGYFQVFTTGTPSQNIADTANSLIRVINRYSSSTVYAFLLSGVDDLPGQIRLQVRTPNQGSFVVTASAHGSAYSPALPTSGSAVSSSQDTNINGVSISKLNESQAVPLTNFTPIGDASFKIQRILPLRGYVLVFKDDGVFKITGSTPSTVQVTPIDDTVVLVGPDTAVPLANQIWCLCNLGIVSVADTGVQIRSRPIATTFTDLFGHAIETVREVSFAIGYETANRYILALPEAQGDTVCKQQFTFNYLTTAWTSWDRLLTTGFIRKSQDLIYIGRGDTNSVSVERKEGDYTDAVDEATENHLVSYDEYVVTLTSTDGIAVGDVLYQSDNQHSVIQSIDTVALTVTVRELIEWTEDSDCDVLAAINATIQWKPVVANNPAFVRQYPEGVLLFKTSTFGNATISFFTDIYQAEVPVDILGFIGSQWGLFLWGRVNWGGIDRPRPIRFYVPGNTQFASQLNPVFNIREGYASWSLEGLSISWVPVSEEVA
jgi:hypothetical protein